MRSTYRFLIVDVFTDTPLEGNQLAVFTNATGMTDAQMQAFARELNFSETTFVLPAEAGGDIRMRIFTPECELPFAGHPTLGTAFALGAPLQRVLLRIETGAGIVPVLLEREGAKIVFGRMQQPLPSVEPFDRAPELFAALGVESSALPVERYNNGVSHLFVALGTDAEVAALAPDMRALAADAGDSAVSCFAVTGAGVKTRVFVPGLGVGEGPATGSAAGPLAVHLARHGLVGWGTEIEIAQGTEIGRPSTLYARAESDDGAIATLVEVGGSAIVVAKGEFSA